MKTIGIKLADGSFYPVLEEGSPKEKNLELTTAHNNQTKVMVDLYRSATCSMDDAEYVDSLQIENLNAHPTGEAEISFSVALDENNELSANIIDEETGEESNTTITLVSRTIEERLVTDEYNISSPDSKKSNAGKVAAGVLAGGGLLAAASRIREKQEAEKNAEDTVTEEPAFDESTVNDETFDSDDLPDFNLDNLEVQSEAEPVSEPDIFASDETVVEENTDFNLGENPVEETEEAPAPNIFEDSTEDNIFASDETVVEENTDFDLGENPVEETEETPAPNIFEDSTESAFTSDDTVVSDDLPDFDFDDQSVEDNSGFSSDDTVASDDLPDFNFDEQSVEDNSGFSSDDTVTSDDLPDFNFDEQPASEETSSFDLVEETADSYDLPDFGDISLDSDTSNSESDIFEEDNFASSNNDYIPTSNGISFTGLYDKETELGESANYESDENSKKTRVPVIICIICAIICVIATMLILFIIPSKYNLISKKQAVKEQTEIVQEEPAEEIEEPVEEFEPEPEPIPEAKENEIVIIDERAEEVIPEQPPVVEEKPKATTYKIKWGDTLWDISNTYYKNPWRYKYIARYNGIKDPDYIISGTTIIIPAE